MEALTVGSYQFFFSAGVILDGFKLGHVFSADDFEVLGDC